MRRRMLFKIGVSVVIGVGVILFSMIKVDVKENEQHYHKMNIDGLNKMKILTEEIIQKGKPPWAGRNSHTYHAEQHFDQATNDQIDKEQADLRKDLKSQRNNAPSKEAKREFYYDNSVPDLDSEMTKKKLFDIVDEKPVFSRKAESRHQPVVHLSVVVCENRAKEALIMLKSAAIVTTTSSLVFHIVADKGRQETIQTELDSWPKELKHRIAYHIYDVAFPKGSVALSSWNKLYKPCASQRLFLPDRLTSVDSLIYVDTDTVFLRSADVLWSHFSLFNSSQLVGMAKESEDGTAGWYNRFASHPYYGEFGVNSGVMLMNLTRIRQTKWLSVLQADYEKYRFAITWGDQDLINIYFSKCPDQLYLISCEWNYRTDHCMYTSNCHSAEHNGVSLLHASRGAFYSKKELAFGAIHQAFDGVVLGLHQNVNLLSDLKRRLQKTAKASNCGQVSNMFLINLYMLVNPSDQKALPQDSLRKNGNSVDSNLRNAQSGKFESHHDKGNVQSHSVKSDNDHEKSMRNKEKGVLNVVRTKHKNNLSDGEGRDRIGSHRGGDVKGHFDGMSKVREVNKSLKKVNGVNKNGLKQEGIVGYNFQSDDGKNTADYESEDQKFFI